MPFKEYSNPLYDVVADEDWTSGLCCIFANALRERFNMDMRALLIKSKHDGSKTLVHAFGVTGDGRMIDARGAQPETSIWEDYSHFRPQDWHALHGAEKDEAIDLVIEDVTLGHLWALNPEDHEATNAAHQYIENHPELFGEFLMPAAA